MIRVLAVRGLATVQDAGRPGRMHQGVPSGGALVAEQLALANEAVGNAPGEAGIEVFGAIRLAADEPVLVADDGSGARRLEPGEAWSVACAGARVRYLAVRGGIDVLRVLGGRGTLLSGGFGGHEGRPLQRGDALRVGQVPQVPSASRGLSSAGARVAAIRALDGTGAIRVVPGPDAERFAPDALDVLLGSPFEVAVQSDRVGVRLRGPLLPRADGDATISAPMVRGAIQVPPSGEPIVLGPDHPTTGGYPVLATVVRADFGALMARPLGTSVRFSR
jgi:5-oxoprolinase (ATP-hydrolysing) subunit C